MKIGYARVSTSGQTVKGQVEQLRAAGCHRVFEETASGAKTDRPRLKALMASLKVGDVLVVTRLDRLARSTSDLLNLMKDLSDRQASFLSLAERWADTTTPTGRLILTVLGGLAEFERELIKARTKLRYMEGPRFIYDDPSHTHHALSPVLHQPAGGFIFSPPARA